MKAALVDILNPENSPKAGWPNTEAAMQKNITRWMKKGAVNHPIEKVGERAARPDAVDEKRSIKGTQAAY